MASRSSKPINNHFQTTMIAVKGVETPGAHIWRVWDRNLVDFCATALLTGLWRLGRSRAADKFGGLRIVVSHLSESRDGYPAGL